ncbi:MAG TPA: Xaa-Pro peptidase family protein [Acidimicrobiia bacterium]|nr:Xaa-Pro peptidase family protein [Acidimicrobiia bacterium]
MFPDFDYAARLDRLRSLMADRGVDVALLSVGADLPYFTGYEAMQTERLTMLVVPRDAEAMLVVPLLEAPRVAIRGAFTTRAWGETEDPIAIVAGVAQGAASIVIADPTWSVFLLALQETLHGASFGSATPLTRELRMRKEPEEIEWLRHAGAGTDRVVDRLGEIRFAGRKERDVAADIAAMTVAEGHDLSTFTILASGPNSASPHHETGSRVIEEGDAIVLDFGGRAHGYHSDTTRTLHVGPPGDRFVEAYAVLEEAQAAGRAAVEPGVAAQDIDRATRAIIDDAGYGEFFIHRTGHGIGLEGHEHPYIVEGNDLPMESGMTFSIEPGIYVPGEFGMRIEDIVAVSPDGVDELNHSDRGLRVVE